jgi:4-amino-4-deoxy-L-arabinose transferase-like glycosyltransferase
LLVLIAGLAVLRLVSAAAIPLTEDEAYYRLWSQHLRLGYYDHPPVIAWWIRAGVTLVGDTALGVRLLPALANLASTVIVFDLGRMIGDGRTGLKAALLYNCTLTIGAAACLAVPDAPAGLFWSLTLWALAKAANSRGARWWLLAGAAAGLATLSKYSALFLAPSVVLWLALTETGRKQLSRPWPWLAAIIALVLFGLNVGWNATHHWETFAKQFGRTAPGRFAPRYLLEFLIGQFLLLNPAVAILAAIGAARAWRERAAVPIAGLMLASLVPFLAYLALHSLHDRVQAHWPVPLYAPAAILAAWTSDGKAGWRAGLVRWAPIGLALSVLALVHAAIPQTDLGRGDPALQLRGWPAFAQAVERARIKAGAAWIGTLSYGVNAQLQAADHHGAPTAQIDERDRYADLAARTQPDLGQPGLIVDLQRRIDIARLRACFARVGPVSEIDRDSPALPENRYGAVAVSGPRIDLLKQGCGEALQSATN